MYEQWQQLTLSFSQVGDGRALGAISARQDQSQIAVGSWSGHCLIYAAAGHPAEGRQPDRPVMTLAGHHDRITDLAWQDAAQDSPHSLLLSGDVGGRLLFWQPAQAATPVAVNSSHQARINRVAFHPLSNYAATTSHDLTWRLWDVSTQTEICQAEGHQRAPFAVAFHPDGSLMCTGGEDALVRIWDLRTGKAIAGYQEHSHSVYAAAFSPLGTLLASGGADNQIRVHDLRTLTTSFVVPAHNSAITRVAYLPTGDALVSAGYDNKVRLWSANDYSQVVALSGHTSYIMGMCVSQAGAAEQLTIHSCSFDKTWKRWELPSLS
jgi:U4/U6 small nuclear ribonucleoprotein PRP4